MTRNINQSTHEQVGFSDGFHWETHCSCGEKFGCDDDGAQLRWYEHKTELLEAEIARLRGDIAHADPTCCVVLVDQDGMWLHASNCPREGVVRMPDSNQIPEDCAPGAYKLYREFIVANLFDGDDGGIFTQRADTLANEIAELFSGEDFRRAWNAALFDSLKAPEVPQ
jgi:hypothetical protein